MEVRQRQGLAALRLRDCQHRDRRRCRGRWPSAARTPRPGRPCRPHDHRAGRAALLLRCAWLLRGARLRQRARPSRPRGGDGQPVEPARREFIGDASPRATSLRRRAWATASRLRCSIARPAGSASASATYPPLQSAGVDHGRRRLAGIRPPASHDRSSDPVVGHAAVPWTSKSYPPCLATMLALPAPQHSSGRDKDRPAERNATAFATALPRWRAASVVPPDF